MDLLEQCRSEGYAAGEGGASKSSNPEIPGSPEHIAWNDGWEGAEFDFERAVRQMEGRDSGGFLKVILIPVALFILIGFGKFIWDLL